MLQGRPELEAILHDKLYTLMQKATRINGSYQNSNSWKFSWEMREAGIIDLYSLGSLLPLSDHVMILLRILAFTFSNSRVRINE